MFETPQHLQVVKVFVSVLYRWYDSARKSGSILFERPHTSCDMKRGGKSVCSFESVENGIVFAVLFI